MAKRGNSSRRWLRERQRDPFVAQAEREGYRARSVFKLIEIDEKDTILSSGQRVVDLGAAPGAWSQYAAKKVGAHGKVVALDILEMDGIGGVDVLQGDFREDAVHEALLALLDAKPVDLVLCDMAPNMAGIRSVDQARSMDLAELALDFALQTLAPGGAFLVKVFQGEGIDAYRRLIKANFAKLVTRKPEASRDRSREQYLLATSFHGGREA